MEIDLIMPFRQHGKDAFHIRYQQWDNYGIPEHSITSTLPEPLLQTSYPKAKRILKPGRTLCSLRVQHLIEKIGNSALRNPITSDFIYSNYLLMDNCISNSMAKQIMKGINGDTLSDGDYFSTKHRPGVLFAFGNTMMMAYYFYTSSYHEYLRDISQSQFEACLFNSNLQSEYIEHYSSSNSFSLYESETIKIFIQSDSPQKPLFMVVSAKC